MCEKFKNLYIFTVTNNAKENIDAFYNNCNTIKKQLNFYWTSLGQLKD